MIKKNNSKIKNAILSVNDTLATLLSVKEDGKVVYEFSYFINRLEAIQKDAIKVVISILNSSEIIENDILQKKSSEIGSVSSIIVSNILKQASNEKDKKIKNSTTNILAKTNSDASITISNENAGKIAKKTINPIFPKKTFILQKSSEPASSNVSIALLATNLVPQNKENFNTKPQNVALDLLFSGKDPTLVTSVNSVSSQQKAVAGLLSNNFSNQEQKKYLNTIISNDGFLKSNGNDFITEVQIPVLVTLDDPKVKLQKNIEFGPLKFSQFILKLELIDKNNNKIDQLVKLIDHQKQLKIFNRPKVAPSIILNSGKIGSQKLSIKQNDPVAQKVAIFRKVLPKLSSNIQEYQLIQEIKISKSNDFSFVTINIDSSNINIFRAVAIGPDGNLGQDFGSVVIKPNKILNQHTSIGFLKVSITAKIDLKGIIVEIRDVPFGISSIRILKRDKTLHQTNFEIIANNLIKQDTIFPLSVIDASVKKNHVYEYRCDFISGKGEIIQSIRNTLIEYIPFIKNLLITSISNIQQSNSDINGIDVSFDISTTVLKNKLDSIKTLIDNANLSEFYKDSLDKQKSELQDLIAYKITRTNLTTGEIADFGIISENSFSDIALGKINGADQVSPGNRYRYEIYPLLRSPETLFDDFKKVVIVNNKKIEFKPSKFLHPLALNEGNITTSETRFANHSKEEMVFGQIGNVEEVFISIPNNIPLITNAQVERVNENLVLIQWNLSSQIKGIDHFLIKKDTLGIQSLIGKRHTISNSNSCDFIYKIEKEVFGNTIFSIIPVYSDYTHGTETKTNEIILI